jgi:hypothetical protein
MRWFTSRYKEVNFPLTFGEGMPMKRQLFHSLVLASSLFPALTGCQSAMSTPSAPPDHESSDGSYSNVNAPWPLEFRAHYFGAHCFDTLECEIRYRGFPHGHKEGPSPSVASYGRPLEELLSAGRGPIPNFPEPAKVTWRSMDGTQHETEIDIGKIFEDQLIRHKVARADITNNATDGMPAIIIEVNDHTINVYMRAMIWLKRPRFSDRPHSDYQDDLIKVFSRTY